MLCWFNHWNLRKIWHVLYTIPNISKKSRNTYLTFFVTCQFFYYRHRRTLNNKYKIIFKFSYIWLEMIRSKIYFLNERHWPQLKHSVILHQTDLHDAPKSSPWLLLSHNLSSILPSASFSRCSSICKLRIYSIRSHQRDLLPVFQRHKMYYQYQSWRWEEKLRVSLRYNK